MQKQTSFLAPLLSPKAFLGRRLERWEQKKEIKDERRIGDWSRAELMLMYGTTSCPVLGYDQSPKEYQNRFCVELIRGQLGGHGAHQKSMADRHQQKT